MEEKRIRSSVMHLNADRTGGAVRDRIISIGFAAESEAANGFPPERRKWLIFLEWT